MATTDDTERAAARAMLATPLDERRDFERTLFDLTAKDWEAIQREALATALVACAKSPFHRERVSASEDEIRRDPCGAALRFPILEKRTYWDHAADLRLPGYDALVAHKFHTSGTELGVPTEQPWDEWTFRRSFCESSALALTRAGTKAGAGVLIGSPSFGALAKSYIWAAERLGLEMHADGAAFGDDATFADVLAFAQRPATDTLIATPGGVVSFIHGVKARGVDPASLKIRRVISGVGNFLSDRHLAHIVEELAPDVVLEQGGKNEILHAPGGVRHDRLSPSRVCPSGFLHYLPHVSYVVAVDARRLDEGILQPIGHGVPGVLLMTRLSSGRDGIVAFVNDAGDLGVTRGIGGGPDTLCPCGNPMPAFRFLGRVGGSVANRLGDTLFVEEFGQALTAASRSVALPADVAARLRFQIVLVRSSEWEMHDTLYWIIGAPDGDRARHGDALRALRARFIEHWVGYPTYASDRYGRYMRIGHGAIVDIAAFPHAGRDKPQYRLSELVEMPAGTTYDAAFELYLATTLKAPVQLA